MITRVRALDAFAESWPVREMSEYGKKLSSGFSDRLSMMNVKRCPDLLFVYCLFMARGVGEGQVKPPFYC